MATAVFLVFGLIAGLVGALVFLPQVEGPVVAEVAAGGQGAELEDGLGAFESPPCAWSQTICTVTCRRPASVSMASIWAGLPSASTTQVRRWCGSRRPASLWPSACGRAFHPATGGWPACGGRWPPSWRWLPAAPRGASRSPCRRRSRPAVPHRGPARAGEPCRTPPHLRRPGGQALPPGACPPLGAPKQGVSEATSRAGRHRRPRPSRCRLAGSGIPNRVHAAAAPAAQGPRNS